MLEDAQKWLPTTTPSKNNTCKGKKEHTGISTNEFVDHEPNLKKYLDTERHRWALLGNFFLMPCSHYPGDIYLSIASTCLLKI